MDIILSLPKSGITKRDLLTSYEHENTAVESEQPRKRRVRCTLATYILLDVLDRPFILLLRSYEPNLTNT